MAANKASRLPALEGRPLKYGYSSCRVKAMKGLILGSSLLNEMIRVGNVEAMVELLQRTGYKNDLAQASVNYRSSQIIELAASRNFGRTVAKLLRIAPKDDRPAVQALLLKWDVMNLRTLMHAKKLKQDLEEVRAQLVPVGGLDEADFKRILKADDKAMLREIRRTRLGQQILSPQSARYDRQAYGTFTSAFTSLAKYFEQEAAIDSHIYLLMDGMLSDVGGKEAAHIRGVLRREIDAKNIMIIERLKSRGIAKERIRAGLIRGGTMNEELVGRIMDAKDLAAALPLVKQKFPQLALRENPTLTSLEIALEKAIAAQKTRAFHREVLSIGVILGFLLLKEEEINNLRKIARGKEYGIPENDVREMLVMV